MLQQTACLTLHSTRTAYGRRVNATLANMKSSVSGYQIEASEILRKAYQLLAYFLANEQIAKIAHPDKSDDPLKSLDARFLFQETSTLLLEVAILFRSLDDQLKSSTDSVNRENYLGKVASTNER